MTRYVAVHGWSEFEPVVTLPASAPPPEQPATVLAAMILGTSVEALARARLRAVSLSRNDDGLVLTLRDARGSDFTLLLGPRDDRRPAYVRTRTLNVSYSGGLLSETAHKLLARVVKSCWQRPFDELARAFEQAQASPKRPRPKMPFEESFGDTACGMMGAVDVLNEVPSDIMVMVHGDRGCMPAPEGGSTTVFSSDMQELDVVSGGEARLLQAVRDALALSQRRPAAVVLLATCLSEMIGDDIEEVAARAEAEHGLPVVAIRSTGLKPSRPVEVARQVHGALAARFLESRPKDGTLGLVGYPDDDTGRFHEELRLLLDRANIGLGGVWPRGGIEGLRRLSAARVVMAPERVAYASLIEKLESLQGPDVVIARAPFGLAGMLAFLREVENRFDRPVMAAAEPQVQVLSERIAHFRRRHEGLRVAVSFGNNRKGTGTMTTVHLGVGFVPFLLELGLDVVLVALSDESERERVQAMAKQLGTSGEVYVHRRPEDLVEVLAQNRFALATNESCQKHFVDAAGVPYLHFMRLEPGFQGALRSIALIEATIMMGKSDG